MKNKKLLFVLLMHILCINHIYAQGLYEKVTSVEQIESGGVFIIVDKDYKYAMGKVGSKYASTEKFTCNTDKTLGKVSIENSEEHPYEITINEESNGYYSLHTAQGYIKYNYDTYLSSNKSSSTDALWNITITSASKYAVIKNKKVSDRFIRFYMSNVEPYFAAYTKSSNNSIYLFRKTPADLSFPVTISSVKYATLYYNDKNLVVPEGIKAYTYKYVDDKLQISKTYNYMDIIPKGTAVVLHGNAGTYTFAEVSSEGVADENNILKGTDEEELIDDDESSYFYMLSLNKDKDPASVGFYWGEENGRAFSNGANKAYLKISKNNVTDAKSSFCFSDITDETTHIASPVVKTSDNNYYTVQGIRVNYPIEKGIYIFNGKKVVIK